MNQDELDSLLFKFARDGDPTDVEGVLAYGADIDRRKLDGASALHVALEACNHEVARFLLARGAYPLARYDDDGTTVLMLASQWDFTADMVSDLISSGAVVNDADSEGKTPLMYAVHSWSLVNAKTLLEAGADVGMRDNSGKTALSRALQRCSTVDSIDLYDLLIASGSVVDCFIASAMGQREFIEGFLGNGGDVDATDVDKHTMLMYAVMHQQEGTVRFLLEQGANPNARSAVGATPLMQAAKSVSIASMLLQSGADVSARNRLGYDPLFFACSHHVLEVVRLLLDHGADPARVYQWGHTPLSIAENVSDEPLAALIEQALRKQ